MDEIFEQEQAHLDETYDTLLDIEHGSQTALAELLEGAMSDKDSILEDFTWDSADDIHVETMVEYEMVNRLMDAYNLHADVLVERLKDAQMLLKQPYFAKIDVRFKPDAPAKSIYIATVGMADENYRHFIVDWRSPVAELYYNQQSGPTSFEANGRVISVDLERRRQFDIDGRTLKAYFDCDIAIEDPLLLAALSQQRGSTLKAITTTIQREQNEVIRHDDVDVLLVNGIAGSGKTSVLLQRIAYLMYRNRETLDARDVYLITPNPVFTRYISNVLPEMGEHNPVSLTYDELMERIGIGSRASGSATDESLLRRIDNELGDFQLKSSDFCDIRVDGEAVITAVQAKSAYDKLDRFACGTHRCALAAEDLLDRLEQRIKRLSKSEKTHDTLLDLGDEEQLRIFGSYISPETDDEFAELSETYLRDRYKDIPEAIERGDWLRIDAIGMRLLGIETLDAATWLYLKLSLGDIGMRSARYVMIDEVQDYSPAQLMTLGRLFPNAHFLMLGDENQAIGENSAQFADIENLFASRGKHVDTCELMTSYRSTPQVTDLFCSLLDEGNAVQVKSVQRDGDAPRVRCLDSDEAYLAALREEVESSKHAGGLTAVIAPNKKRMLQIAEMLVDDDVVLGSDMETLPQEGIVALSVKLAKGLEFDRVIVTDADELHYPLGQIARNRLYTAISRATKDVALLANTQLTPLLSNRI